MIYVISISVFLSIIFLLLISLFLVQNIFVKKTACKILINEDEEKSPTVESGVTLLAALANEKIFIPSACGGGGSCAMCKVQVLEGGGSILPTEIPHISLSERKQHIRLSCQVKVRQPMKIHIPDEVFNIRKYECEVVSNNNVATFIKELVLKLPEGMPLHFKAGGYIQIYIPSYQLKFKQFEIETKYHPEWDQYKLWDLEASNDEEIFRAYSMANYPVENDIVMLNVRIATPPQKAPHAPPGISSSYIFGLKPGDKVVISGPYGEFFAQDSQREMCFVGGGAGMAPMRSHIFDQFKRLKTNRKVTFWYGARSLREMFYEEEFRNIEKEFPNFKFYAALSEPLPEDKWSGMTGFIHQCLYERYLSKHDDPTEVEYYLCGPPPMLAAVQKMLYECGVEKEMIAFDDFGI